MNILSVKSIDRLVERFCLWLGRYSIWSKFLDGIASAVFPSFVNPLLLPGAVGALRPLSQFVSFMAGQSSVTENNLPGAYDEIQAPIAPNAPYNAPGEAPHSQKECAPKIFHGMHGAPCKFHGGTLDNKFCPPGTESGLWWRWNIPGVGNVYYVDCCGLPIEWKVWCNWAKEINWCDKRGNDVYTCTITLLHNELKKDGSGHADISSHVLAGPPAPSPAPPTPSPRVYIVVSGDNLSKIAKNFYGNANLWNKIYQANRALIGPDPNKIYPGQQLTIP